MPSLRLSQNHRPMETGGNFLAMILNNLISSSFPKHCLARPSTEAFSAEVTSGMSTSATLRSARPFQSKAIGFCLSHFANATHSIKPRGSRAIEADRHFIEVFVAVYDAARCLIFKKRVRFPAMANLALTASVDGRARNCAGRTHECQCDVLPAANPCATHQPNCVMRGK